MDDLAAQGISSVLVEGGASVATNFLKEKLVDRLVLFHSPVEIGATNGVAVTDLQSHIDNEFTILRNAQYGDDACIEYVRKA
jgi:diaminohydroxyphosphoribosylaminopyrimidine deaminase/5-amino-6-(5-phosphoribosylamino)uracil reductase